MNVSKSLVLIIAFSVILMGSDSAIAHHYPSTKDHAEWTKYEGTDGYMEVSEEDITSSSMYADYMYVGVFILLPEGMTATEYCEMPFFSHPVLYDEDGQASAGEDGSGRYYNADCYGATSAPLFKDPDTGELDDSERCFVHIGFVSITFDDDVDDLYRWDSSNYLFVESPQHMDAMAYDDNGQSIDCSKGEFPMVLVLGAAVTAISILGGIFYWRKDDGIEEESEFPVQQPESSKPAAVNDQVGSLLEENESNQEKNEDGLNSKFCPSCGLSNDSNGKFCKDCGIDLSV